MSSYTLIHALKGYKNKNWPIRSAFYKFKENSTPTIGRGPSADDLYGASDPLEKTMEGQALLATGSADPYVYVYSLGNTEVYIY
jgi:COMPASS component SWD3